MSLKILVDPIKLLVEFDLNVNFIDFFFLELSDKNKIKIKMVD